MKRLVLCTVYKYSQTLKVTVKDCKLSAVFFNQFNQVKDLISMELSGVNNTKLQSAEQNLTEKKTDETATPEHGGGVYIPNKASTDSVNISTDAIEKLDAEQVQTFHGGGVYVPPKKEN